MKIIHVLSNWKWTERSELVVELALSQRRLGHDVWLICGRPSPEDGDVLDVSFHAAQKGLENIIDLPDMSKHIRIFSLIRGSRRLREIFDRIHPEVVHCHMRNAHLLAGLAGKCDGAPLWIRSVYNPDQVPRDYRSRWCYRHCTRGIIVIREKVRQSILSRRFPAETVIVLKPGIDLERFAPERELADQALHFELPDDAFVVGVVSRIRPTRRLDIPLDVIHRLKDQYPRLRLLLVGRGRSGAFERVVERPAAERGIRGRIIQAGYCLGDDLVAAYRRMQVLLYPMPGTDRTCRTVREALAAGVPVIAPDMDYLPELIQDGRNGYLVDQSPSGFAAALQTVMDDPDMVERLSRQALVSARERFDWGHLAEETLGFYERLR